MAAAGALLLTGCTADADGSGVDEEVTQELPEKFADAPPVEEAIDELCAAIDSGDEAALAEMIPNYDDLDVRIPDVAPQRTTTLHVADGAGAFDGASLTVEVPYQVGEARGVWEAQLRYLTTGGGDPHWQITNALTEASGLESGSGSTYADAGFEVTPTNGDIAGESTFTSLPGAYEYVVSVDSDLVEVTSDPVLVPVLVGDAKADAPGSLEAIAAEATVELSSAGIDEVASNFSDVVTMCSNWCDEPSENDWQALEWGNTSDGTGIFTITSSAGSSKVTPVTDDSAVAADWADPISHGGGSAASVYAEVSPVSIDYSKTDCSGASNCSVESGGGLPSSRDDVRLLYRVDGETITLVALLGNR
jgi:hypothetical protein